MSKAEYSEIHTLGRCSAQSISVCGDAGGKVNLFVHKTDDVRNERAHHYCTGDDAHSTGLIISRLN